jgi:hypothetical protein
MPSLEARMKAARRKLEELQAKARREDRTARTHRLIVYGSAFLAMVAAMPEEKRGVMLARVHKHVTDDAGRRRLGLAPLPKPSEASEPVTSSDEPPGEAAQRSLPLG